MKVKIATECVVERQLIGFVDIVNCAESRVDEIQTIRRDD